MRGPKPLNNKRRMSRYRYTLSDEQASAIRRRAVIDGTSKSAVVRDAVNAHLGLIPEEKANAD